MIYCLEKLWSLTIISELYRHNIRKLIFYQDIGAAWNLQNIIEGEGGEQLVEGVLPHVGGEEGENGSQVGHQTDQAQPAEHHPCKPNQTRVVKNPKPNILSLICGSISEWDSWSVKEYLIHC